LRWNAPLHDPVEQNPTPGRQIRVYTGACATADYPPDWLKEALKFLYPIRDRVEHSPVNLLVDLAWVLNASTYELLGLADAKPNKPTAISPRLEHRVK
jgi:hypothetical protein